MPTSRTLVVVDDRHAAGNLQRLMDRLPADSQILTADPVLGLQARHEGYDARLTVDGLDPALVADRDGHALDAVRDAYRVSARDWSRLDGTSYGTYFHYTLIPKFIRTVRNLWSLGDVATRDPPTRFVIVGHGELAAAAAAFARARGIGCSHVRAAPWHRAQIGLARLIAGRRHRWVNSDVRALILEPAFLALLALRSLLTSRQPRPFSPGQPVFLVTGDRFTHALSTRLRQHGAAIIVAGATAPGRRLFRRFDGAMPLERFGRPADIARAIDTCVRAAGRAWRLLRMRESRATFVTDGVDAWPLVRRAVALHLAVWPALLRHLALLAARAAAACPQARVVVSSDVTAYNKMLLDAAAQAGLASFGVQHGILGEPNGHSEVQVETLATWGMASERWYRERSEPRCRFVITGNPAFDALADRVWSRVRQPPARPRPFTILVCTGFVSEYSVCASEYENLQLLQAVIDWAGAHPDGRVIHKLHPGEESGYYDEVWKRLRWPMGIIERQQKADLYDLIEAADVLVAGYSTTVLEAVALGTPAVVIDAIARRHHIPLDRSPDITIAFSLDELQTALSRHLYRRRRVDPSASASQAFLTDYLDGLDGEATGRVLALVGENAPRAPQRD